LNGKFFAVRPEAYYDFINARHPDGYISMHGVTVPLNLMLQYPRRSPVSIAVFAGPYYSYRFQGKQGGVQLDFDNDFKRDEWGLNYGFELRIMKVHLGYAHRQSFTDFTRMPNAVGAHIRNRASFFTLSYTF
jgi:hypothetical protein